MSKSGLILLAGLTLATVSCTDKADYNSYDEDGLISANRTLWENISNDTQLTKFASLLKMAGSDSLFSNAGYQTIWAPVDEYFSEADYSALSKLSSEELRKQFVQQHMIRHSNAVPSDSLRIITINGKHHDFTSKGFDGYDYQDYVSGSGINIPSANGLIHKIKGMSAYYPNLYEYIDNLQGCDSIKKYLQKYDEVYIDENQSVAGPVKDGKQTYVYTVTAKRNNVIETLIGAKMADEDSTYTVLFPTDKVWNNMSEVISSKYNYLTKMKYKDLDAKARANNAVPQFTTSSKIADMKKQMTEEATKNSKTSTSIPQLANLKDSLIKSNIVNNIAFSDSNPYNAPLFSSEKSDSIVTTKGKYLTSVDLINSSTIFKQPSSNGIIRIVDEYPYYSWESYEPIAREGKSYAINATGTTVKTISKANLVGRDSLFSEIPGWLKELVLPESSRTFSYVTVDSTKMTSQTSKLEIDFELKDVQSTTYRIFVVTVPRQVMEPDQPERPFYFRFFLSYTNEKDEAQAVVLPLNSDLTEANQLRQQISTAPKGTTTNVTYLGNPGRLNVMDLGEFTFPVSYKDLSGIDDLKDNYPYPSLMITQTMAFTSSTNRNKYDQFPRIAGIYLVPKDYYDSYLNDK